jgi:hypothetical protein
MEMSDALAERIPISVMSSSEGFTYCKESPEFLFILAILSFIRFGTHLSVFLSASTTSIITSNLVH